VLEHAGPPEQLQPPSAPHWLARSPQSEQVPPFGPHSVEVVEVTQLPLESQQPLPQLAEVHLHAPLMHSLSAGHAAPVIPQTQPPSKQWSEPPVHAPHNMP
jgi:hypothetical protein